jgi:hypothetical protein
LYIPLSMQIEGYEYTNFHLRYIDIHSILELGVSPKNGMLVSITLVIASNYSVGKMPPIPDNIEKGLPLFDLSLWKGDRLKDIDRPVELVFVDDNALLLIMDKNVKAEKVLWSENLKFAISDGYPCWLLIDNLTSEQIAHVKSEVYHKMESSKLYINN